MTWVTTERVAIATSGTTEETTDVTTVVTTAVSATDTHATRVRVPVAGPAGPGELVFGLVI
jgi:hypothetical protein